MPAAKSGWSVASWSGVCTTDIVRLYGQRFLPLSLQRVSLLLWDMVAPDLSTCKGQYPCPMEA